MRPLETERYLVFRIEQENWVLVLDTIAESAYDAIKEAVSLPQMPLGPHEYRAVTWDAIDARATHVWRESKIDSAPPSQDVPGARR